MSSEKNSTTRRDFLKTSTAAVAGAGVVSSIARSAHAAGSDVIKLGLVGCGGRGTGATANIMNTKGNVKLVAVADAFQAKAEGSVKNLAKKYGDKVAVTARYHVLRTGRLQEGDRQRHRPGRLGHAARLPPALHFEYAVAKGRHVFMEKPVATDAPGIRRVLAAVEEAKKKNLMVGVGLQRRHEPRYMETVKKLQDGAIGDIILARVYWNGGGIWYRDRVEGQSEMEFQCNNWYHFVWVSGDQICEQHIHNLDVGCWVKDQYPVECNGMGGGENRLGGDRSKSQIFDHTFCEFTFADGTKMYSQGRHVQGAWTNVSEAVHGSKGTANPNGSIDIAGQDSWRFRGDSPGGHQQEQHDLIEALMRGEVYNEGEYGAKSTFTAILGREACYSGKVIKWDELLQKGKDLAPGIDSYTMKSAPPVVKDANGVYPAAIPGSYNPFA